MDELDALGERRLLLAGRLQRAVEVVDRRQQLLGELGDAALLRERGLARRALAVVLEVGLRALREQQVLVGLLGLGRELVEVLLDLLLGRPRGSAVRLGRRLFGAVLRPAACVGGRAALASAGAVLRGGACRRLLRRLLLHVRAPTPRGRRRWRSAAIVTCPRRRLRRRPRPRPRRRRRRWRRRSSPSKLGRRRLLLGALVHRLGDLVEGGVQRVLAAR